MPDPIEGGPTVHPIEGGLAVQSPRIPPPLVGQNQQGLMDAFLLKASRPLVDAVLSNLTPSSC